LDKQHNLERNKQAANLERIRGREVDLLNRGCSTQWCSLPEKLLSGAADRRRVEQNGKLKARADRWLVLSADTRQSCPGGASSELLLPTGDSRCLVVRAAAAELPGRGVTGE
jgi:hypothetical protein